MMDGCVQGDTNVGLCAADVTVSEEELSVEVAQVDRVEVDLRRASER